MKVLIGLAWLAGRLYSEAPNPVAAGLADAARAPVFGALDEWKREE